MGAKLLTDDLSRILINALPLLVLIAVWLFLVYGTRKRSVRQWEAAQENTAAINANTEAVVRLAAALEKRTSEPRN